MPSDLRKLLNIIYKLWVVAVAQLTKAAFQTAVKAMEIVEQDTCGSGNKLAVFDWLSNMTLPTGEAPFNIYEVRFKNGRKHFYKSTEKKHEHFYGRCSCC